MLSWCKRWNDFYKASALLTLFVSSTSFLLGGGGFYEYSSDLAGKLKGGLDFRTWMSLGFAGDDGSGVSFGFLD